MSNGGGNDVWFEWALTVSDRPYDAALSGGWLGGSFA